MIEQMIKDIKAMSVNELKLHEMKIHDSMLDIKTKRVLLDEIDKRFKMFQYAGDGMVEMSEIKAGEM